jgi:hypothetical protein
MNLGRGKRPFALTRDVAVLIHTCIQQRPTVNPAHLLKQTLAMRQGVYSLVAAVGASYRMPPQTINPKAIASDREMSLCIITLIFCLDAMVGKRWTVQDHYGYEIYLTEERWEHINEQHSGTH